MRSKYPAPLFHSMISTQRNEGLSNYNCVAFMSGLRNMKMLLVESCTTDKWKRKRSE